MVNVERSGRQIAAVVKTFCEDTLEACKALKPTDVRVDDMPLEDIMVALVGPAEG